MIRQREYGRCIRFIMVLATVLCLLCGTQLLSCPAHAAENGLQIEAAAVPSEMVEPQEVTLNFTVENSGETSAENVVLSSSDGLVSEAIGAIEAHGTQSFSRRHTVTQEELDAGKINCVLSCDDPEDEGHVLNYPVSIVIGRCEPKAAAEFTRHFSGTHIRPGDALEIVYTIRNTGNVELTALCVTDAAGSYTGRVEKLAAGETATLVNRVTMFDEDVVSDAVLSYEQNDETEDIRLSETTVFSTEDALEGTLTAQALTKLPQTAQVTLTLRASGEMPYHDIRVTDALYGGVIAEGISLAPGEETSVSNEYALREQTDFVWYVTGRRDDGSTISFTTDKQTLTREEPLTVDAVSLSAEALTPDISRAGKVKVRITLENSGDGDVRHLALNVKADEQPTERLYDFAVLPAGGKIQRDFEFEIEHDTHLAFAVTYDTEDGGAGARDGAFADISVTPDGALPEGEEPGFIDISGGSIKIAGSRTFAIFMIVGVVILLALIAVLTIASRRARFREQVRREREKERKREKEKK